MKIILLIASISTAVSISAHSEDYEGFIAPSSLGKNINTLNSQYELGLKEHSKGRYGNKSSADCDLMVKTDEENRVNYIKVTHKQNCRYSTTSNVNYNSKSTKTKDILGQVNIKNIQFVPRCLNCPSRVGVLDRLVVNRAEDKYYTEFEIQGANKDYIKYIAKDLFGNFSDDDYNTVMNKLQLRAAENDNFYDRNEFKLQAIDSYNLQGVPLSYTIALK